MKTLPIERHEEAREATKPLAPPDLRERVINRIKKERSNFHMIRWGCSEEPYKLACGTTACLAGFILLVCGETFDDSVPEVQPTRFWDDLDGTPARARELWASVYGVESAKRLPFYATNMSPDDLIAWLREEAAR